MEPQVVKQQEDARQGRGNVGVRYVLAFGVALVVIAFAVIALVRPW